MLIDLMSLPDYRPMRFKELCALLDIAGDEREELFEVLTELTEEYKIILTNKNKYMIAPKDTLIGTYCGTRKDFGFVSAEGYDDDFFIGEGDHLNAFDGDTVLIKVIPDKTGPRKEAIVVRIIKRAFSNILGIYQKSKNYGFVVPYNKKISKDIFIPGGASLGAVSGNIVICEIKDYGDNRNSPEGYISEIIGHIDDPSSDIMAVVRNAGIPFEFPEEVEKALEDIPEEVSDKDKEGRRDFRNLPTVTIDGEDAKDLDDAITLSYSDGLYHLGVHIADVSNYVTEGSALDKEALKRGTSCYLVDSVIPMIPHKLSNGICSLNQGVDRLTLSCLMDIDSSGKVVSHEICEGLICVNERMNYTDVAKIIDGDEDAPLERYSSLISMFKLMKELSDIIRARRKERGSIDFDLPETKIITDENHEPVSIKPYPRNSATLIIEDFMLSANETIAEEYFWSQIPFEYRIHEAPGPEKVDQLKEFMKNFGLYFKVSRDNIHPKEYQKLLDKIKGLPYEALIANLTLRSMQQARYSPVCEGHFGLAAKYYCHFTSPIRRYPDLQIHRIIKENLRGTLDQSRIKHYQSILGRVSEDNSAKERRAVEAERNIDRLKEIEYMSKRIGNEYEGIISGFTSQNIFVQLPNTVEGAVYVASITDDYYDFREDSYSMVGQRTGRKYTLGDKVRIKVVKADKAERTIDFIFTE